MRRGGLAIPSRVVAVDVVIPALFNLYGWHVRPAVLLLHNNTEGPASFASAISDGEKVWVRLLKVRDSELVKGKLDVLLRVVHLLRPRLIELYQVELISHPAKSGVHVGPGDQHHLPAQ